MSTPNASAPAAMEKVGDYAVRLGDDALILAHRLSEWCGRGPFLEEDLALTNVALDYIGRARMFYSYAAELRGNGCTEDSLAYLRDCREFTNLLICELPRGDFACTMARQFLFDAYALPYMHALQNSTDARLAAIAAKAIKESSYHLRRSRSWMLRLGDGTQESHDRLQKAIAGLWAYTPEMFITDATENELAAAGIGVCCTALRPVWEQEVGVTLTAAGIEIPSTHASIEGGRQGIHTEWLGHLLSELQFMQRAYPGLQW